VTIGVQRRPWHTNGGAGRIAGEAGYLYDVTIAGRDGSGFDYRRFLQDTEHLHINLVHVCLDQQASSVRLTIPAVLGARLVNMTIQDAITRVPNSLRPDGSGDDRADEVRHLAEQWPEYVLEPGDPLCQLTSDAPTRFFMV
jgi:hypothetical protein